MNRPTTDPTIPPATSAEIAPDDYPPSQHRQAAHPDADRVHMPHYRLSRMVPCRMLGLVKRWMPGLADLLRGWEDLLEGPDKRMRLPGPIPSLQQGIAWSATHERFLVLARIRGARPGLTSIGDKRSV
jgi:hypothetical protein